jgi:hypothetical protein
LLRVSGSLWQKAKLMSWIFASPSLDDLIRLLKAWKFWVLGAMLGAFIGALIYYVAPPAYQARATVNVDFNLEQAWPQETDRQQFYYLERETRKLVEIAWSDDVMRSLAADSSVPMEDLRNGILLLSQPAEAGWHFYAKDNDLERARDLAGAWALLFEEKVREEMAQSDGLNSFINVDATQVDHLSVERSISLSSYLLAGAALFLALSAIVFLFFPSSQPLLRSVTQSPKRREGK